MKLNNNNTKQKTKFCIFVPFCWNCSQIRTADCNQWDKLWKFSAELSFLVTWFMIIDARDCRRELLFSEFYISSNFKFCCYGAWRWSCSLSFKSFKFWFSSVLVDNPTRKHKSTLIIFLGVQFMFNIKCHLNWKEFARQSRD